MKKYITILTSLLLVPVLVFNNTVSAASVTHTLSMPSTVRCALVNQYTPPYDSTDNPIGDYALYTYEFSFDVVGILSGGTDSYINGVATSSITLGYQIPAGYTLQAFPHSVTTSYTDHYISVCNTGTAWNSQPVYCRTIFSNYFTSSNIFNIATISGQITISKTITPSNLPDPPQYVTISVSGSVSDNISGSVDPADSNMAHEIATAIVNGLNDINGPIDDLLNYIQTTNSTLSDIYQHNEAWYSAIVDELLTNNQWNSTITDELIALYQELSINTNATINIATYTADLRAFMQTFPTWSAQMLQLLGKLADMSAAEQTEAAAIASQYDSLQQQQDDANAVVKAVPRPTFSASQFDSSNMVDTTQRQNFTGLLSLIVGNGYITRIFIIVVTFATAGFILFGKKK